MLRVAVALCLLFAALETHAQVSGSVTLLSDYRFRGISLSDGRPALQAAAAFDNAGGWYAGALGSTARLEPNARAGAQLLVYAGFAQRIRNGLSWEFGAQYTRFTGREHYAYPELYLGLASEHLSGRLYLVRRYFGAADAMYAELNGVHMQSERIYLFGHLGVLRRDGPTAYYRPTGQYRFDLRVGIGMILRAGNLQLGWTTTRGAAAQAFGYPVSDRPHRDGWVISLSRLW